MTSNKTPIPIIIDVDAKLTSVISSVHYSVFVIQNTHLYGNFIFLLQIKNYKLIFNYNCTIIGTIYLCNYYLCNCIIRIRIKNVLLVT